MARVLLTGMSGTGKSTVIAELAARGYRAVDLDCDEYSEWVEVAGEGLDWRWREDRVHDLLADDDAELLVVSGCAENMGIFLPRFDEVVLLAAPDDVIVERLSRRSEGEYGTRPGDVARVLDHVQTVEPLLRRIAGHEIDTSAPLEDVVVAVLEIARTPAP